MRRNIHCCQINDKNDSYHHYELTTTWHKDGVIRTCWYHDNHIIEHGMGGMGMKAHNLFTIPLCQQHHDEYLFVIPSSNDVFMVLAENLFSLLSKAL
ncbi:DUF968 domain-containing protein [Proteus columbae]|uniref:DUF968 domain-containing protein n=1 Tax=Proteus columbae TaxID=1987580 RepID=UPI0018C63AD9|nr:DUF968 domain-containing protein [Proteus columbae]